MTAVVLLALGVRDLVGSRDRPRSDGRARRGPLLAGLLAAVLGAAVLAATGRPETLAPGALLAAAAVLAVWDAAGADRPATLLGCVAAVGLVAVLDVGTGREGEHAAPTPLVLAAVAVALAESANRATRAVLQLAGRRPDAPVPDGPPEPPLRGGRYIGPMERLLMVVLGLAQAWPVIAALMAAKGIVRFPEISADRGEGSRAEEFLVGSLASWGLAALGGLLAWHTLAGPAAP